MAREPILNGADESLECGIDKEGSNEKLVMVTKCVHGQSLLGAEEQKKRKCCHGCCHNCCRNCYRNCCACIRSKEVQTKVLTLWSAIAFAFTLYTMAQLFVPKVEYVSTIASRTYVVAYGTENGSVNTNATLWLDVKAFEEHFNVSIVHNNNSDYYYKFPLIIHSNNSWYGEIVPAKHGGTRPDWITFTRRNAPISKSANRPISWVSLIFDIIMSGLIIPLLDKAGANAKEKLKDEPFCTQLYEKARISILLMIWPLLWTLWSLPTNSFQLACPENICVINRTGITASFILASAKFFWLCWGILMCTICVRLCIDEQACQECYSKCTIWVLIGWFVGSLIGIYWKIKAAVASAELAYALGLYAIARVVNDWFADSRFVWGALSKLYPK